MQKFKPGFIIDNEFSICLIVQMTTDWAKLYQISNGKFTYTTHDEGTFADSWRRIDLLDT